MKAQHRDAVAQKAATDFISAVALIGAIAVGAHEFPAHRALVAVVMILIAQGSIGARAEVRAGGASLQLSLWRYVLTDRMAIDQIYESLKDGVFIARGPDLWMEASREAAADIEIATPLPSNMMLLTTAVGLVIYHAVCAGAGLLLSFVV